MAQSARANGGTLPPWPSAVRTELARRRAGFAPASGRELDLDEAGAWDQLDPTPDQPFARIVSVGSFTAHADLGAVVRAVAEGLAVGGELLLVEPVGRPGWRGTMVASIGANAPQVRGRHLNRDVPAAIRAAGLLLSDVERFTVAPSAWPLKHFVQARALKLDVPLERTVDHDGAPSHGGAA